MVCMYVLRLRFAEPVLSLSKGSARMDFSLSVNFSRSS